MKCELAAALLHRPAVLFLDEPTIGLDVVSQKIVREFLRTYNQTHQTTILLTSHYMADIQELCRRVIIIDHGKIFFDGRLSEIVDRFADFKLVTIQCDGTDASSDGSLAKYGEVVETLPGSIKLKIKRDRVIPACKALLDELPVRDIDIEEVLLKTLFARSLRDEHWILKLWIACGAAPGNLPAVPSVVCPTSVRRLPAFPRSSTH